MHLEERIEKLERTIEMLTEQLRQTNKERWVTPAELAEIMQCSVNNIYIKIRSGEIYATEKLGNIKRIPMSQFYSREEDIKREKANETKRPTNTIREKVFGF